MKGAGWLRNNLGLAVALATVPLSMFAGSAHALAKPWQLNLTKGVTQTSHEVYAIHMWGLYTCLVIGVVVFSAMIYAMFKFRKSKGAVPATWSHNSKAEIIWTIIPILILIMLAWPATKVMISMADVSGAQMVVKITGYQWKWGYDYVSVDGKPYHVNFISRLDKRSDKTRELKSGLDPWAVKDNGQNTYLLDVDHPLVVPTDTKIQFLITGADVIHAWWVPQLGWKQDAIPGIINTDWTNIHEPGIYRGQCAELCGQDHGFMPIVVKAMPKAEFMQWLQAQEAAATKPATTAAANTATATASTAPAAD